MKCDRAHSHTVLQGNRTCKAAIYPHQLVDAICEGINQQFRADQLHANMVATLEIEHGLNILESLKTIQNTAAQCNEEHDIDEENYAVDGVSGIYLDPQMEARADEIT